VKTLVIYASKHGSAEKCAAKLSERLSEETYLCNLKDGKIPELLQYERIIIGGSIYAGRIQREVSEFCINNINELMGKKLGFYICCMNKGASETQLKDAFPQELFNNAIAKESFGGEFKFRDMNFMEKTITKMISKVLAKDNPDIPAIDMKKDLSLLSEEKIDKFAGLMNSTL
jgi:menaquinone-dependent protoporphyrinogen oxidase